MEQRHETLVSPNTRKEYVVAGQLVELRDRTSPGVSERAPQSRGETPKSLTVPEVFNIEQVAGTRIDGIDNNRILSEMADIGPEARLFVYRKEGKVVRTEVFEDPRICHDIHRGAVIENLKEKPKDVSGWRTHDFFIDLKGCLGDECGRCAIVCPENAIHLMGKGKGSFHEIDPLACKGCFICWVECFRTAADCILVDGKTFDPLMRTKHFGE
jgi:Pyruvate/2-oxoacid:ferredoxin oxidoreductase delta subunit